MKIMSVSSWFRNTNNNDWNHGTIVQVSVKDSIKALYPRTTHFDRHLETNGSSRFSQLLLEHGEKTLQDWAVVAYSTPSTDPRHSGEYGNTGSYRDGQQSNQTSRSNGIQWAQAPPKSANDQKKNYLTSPNSFKRKTSTTQTVDKETFPTAHMSKIEGRLHLCSGSLVFEPIDTSRGIIRCPFSKMDGPPIEHPVEAGFESMCVEFSSRRHIVMKINNTIGPYHTVLLPCRFRFTFLHSTPSSFVELSVKLFSMAASGKNRPSHTSPELDALMKPMLDRTFDPCNVVDVREQLLTPSMRCAITTPLQSRPGTLVLTAERIYFQQAKGIMAGSDTRVDSWLQRSVVASARRYNGLRDSALEIYWRDESSTLFAFERRHDREQVMRFLSNTTVPCFTDRDFVVKIVQEWQKGSISNYDYLLALNSAAGRSFHDLSRYPVFPWVLADFESAKLDLTKESTFRDLSKPVGALNKERLEYFQTRLKGMQDMEEAFLYGTHYSAPGYVLYFLIRSMPEHMLCLQNGKFDSPDRIFDSVAQCYSSALTNHADVKELIPEFYSDGHDFDFLINVKGLQLGATQNGDRVNDVKLPTWARSARDFIKKNRKALESDICTRMLPRWIDLIFGCKSRGEGAVKANNIFHHNAYLGPTDLAGMQTEEERFQAELQATEFGIVPDMLFRNEHPQKTDTFDEDFISLDLGRASSKDESGREAWELLDVPAYDLTEENTSNITSVESHPTHGTISDTKQVEASLTDPPWQDAQVSAVNNASDTMLTPVPLRGTGEGNRRARPNDEQVVTSTHEPSQSGTSPRLVHNDSPKVLSVLEGSSSSLEWDISVIERKQIHSDTVSGCILFLDEDESRLSVLVTTSLDGGLVVHTVALNASSVEQSESTGFVSPFTRFSYNNMISRAGQSSQATTPSKLSEYRTHTARDPLASLVLASDGSGGSVAFAGGHDDVVLAYGIKSACAVASVYSHRDAVTALDLITRTPFDSESALWLENSTHILVSGSWDATVKVWSASVASGETVAIHREPLAELFDADSSIICLSAQSIPSGGIVIAAGCVDGCFCVWDVHNDGVQVLIHKEPARKGGGQCSVVKCVAVAGKLHLYAAFSNGRLASYTLVGGTLRRESAVSLGVAITSLLCTTEGILLAGCADGGLRLVPIRENVYFEAKPTLWKAINNKNTSPGITSISLAYTQNKCICCTGGTDGSVVLFELVKVGRQCNG
jgi:factor associated with neutral sphingomyelinase activation